MPPTLIPVADPHTTARILWWLRNRARPTGPAEGQQLLALIHDLEAAGDT